MELLKADFQFVCGDRTSNQQREVKNVFLDITDSDRVSKVFSEEKPEVVLHLAAMADLQLCEQDKELAHKVNVEGTKNLFQASASFKPHFIFVSTGFVFKGDQGDYHEHDIPDPQSYYGATKFEAEELVKKSGLKSAIIRFNYPYRASFEGKSDCVRWLIPKFQQKEKVTVVKDQFLKPVFIDQISEAIRLIIKKKKEGIFHLADTTRFNWVELAKTVAEVFGFDEKLIKETTYEAFIKETDRIRSPSDVSLNTKMSEAILGLKMISFKQGLAKIKQQWKAFPK